MLVGGRIIIRQLALCCKTSYIHLFMSCEAVNRNGCMLSVLGIMDSGARSKFTSCLKTGWDTLIQQGPMYEYFVSPTKSWLTVKLPHAPYAFELFANSALNITSEGEKKISV